MYGQRGGHRQKREIGARRVHELREKEGVLSEPHQHVLWEACVCVGGGGLLPPRSPRKRAKRTGWNLAGGYMGAHCKTDSILLLV